MKTRRTKFLLSLLTMGILGFSMVSASYTFEVANRNPFGVLNLSKLIIKPDTSTESMELSGYTLKIMTTNGKLYVHQICDENGENCSNAADIGGGNGSGITATGTTGNYCYLLENGNLQCNNTELETLINKILQESPNTPKNARVSIYQGGVFKGSFTLNQDTDTGIYLDLGSGGSGGISANGTTGNYCYLLENGNLRCNNAELETLINKILQESPNTPKNATVSIYQGGVFKGSFTLNQDTDTGIYLDLGSGGSGGVIPSGTTGHYCKLTNNGGLECDGDSSNWGGDGDGIWTQNDSTQQTDGFGFSQIVATIHPKSNTYNVNIGNNNDTSYKLNVNGSGRFATKLNVGDNLIIKSSDSRRVFEPWKSVTNMSTETSPMVSYTNNLIIRQQTGLSASNDYFMMGSRGNVGIGGESNTGTIKLSVYGHSRIYSSYASTNSYFDRRYLDLYNDGTQSFIISKRSALTIGLTGDQDWVGSPVPSSNIQFGRNAIGFNKTPTQNTYNPNNAQAQYYVPRVQVNGSIQISSEFQPSNTNTQQNMKFKCREEIVGTIAYRSGQFYGCAQDSAGYHWRYFTTQTFNDDQLPAVNNDYSY